MWSLNGEDRERRTLTPYLYSGGLPVPTGSVGTHVTYCSSVAIRLLRVHIYSSSLRRMDDGVYLKKKTGIIMGSQVNAREDLGTDNIWTRCVVKSPHLSRAK